MTRINLFEIIIGIIMGIILGKLFYQIGYMQLLSWRIKRLADRHTVEFKAGMDAIMKRNDLLSKDITDGPEWVALTFDIEFHQHRMDVINKKISHLHELMVEHIKQNN